MVRYYRFLILCLGLLLPSFVFIGSSQDSKSSGHATQSQQPAFLASAQPNDYTEGEFNGELRKRLTPAEAALVKNPLIGSPRMAQFALELTKGTSNDLQKARAIFDGLVNRTNAAPSQFPTAATALQILDAWSNPETSFRCQELAFFYVALARAAGLKAHHVFVERDCHGVFLLHACASVFVADKMLLVDLAYGSFGVAHRKFTVLNDLETAAVYLSGMQSSNLGRVAFKLAPNLSVVCASLFDALSAEGNWSEAEGVTEAMMRFDSEGPMSYFARGMLAAHARDPATSLQLLRKAVDMAPQTDSLHFALGSVYAWQRQWAEARESYQNALRYALYEKGVQRCKEAIDFVDASASKERARDLRIP